MNSMNVYFHDANIFFNCAIKNINSFMEDSEAIESILFFALGLERLFKGILNNVNPIYVLKDQDFKNSVGILYRDKFIKNLPNNKEVNFNAKGDLINYREALSRARCFSNIANQHSSLFYKISNYRDLIAHCELSKLNIDEIKAILNRDFTTIIKSFSQELSLRSLLEFKDILKFNALDEQSIRILENERLEETIKMKLLSHYKIWESRKTDLKLCESIKDKVGRFIGKTSKYRTIDEFKCPACGNTALINFDYEPAIIENEECNGEYFLTELQCYYCDLKIDDYKELEHLGIEEDYWEEFANSIEDDYYD